MQQQPQTHIVYRSKSEQMQDEYLWGEGIFSPTGATDILIILAVVAALFIGWGKFGHRLKRRKF